MARKTGSMEEPIANILVIDDEIGMREGCRRVLGPKGFQVVTAEHGVEGLRKLRGGRFDLVLLDVMMPGMGGLEVLDRIHEHDPNIICVMITGFATVDLAAQAMKQGARDFLPKPFSSDELLEVVHRGLDQRQRLLALEQRREQEEESMQLERVRQDVAKFDAIESRFMLVLVHQLRNPAGVLKNYLQLMRAGYVDDDEWDEYLEKLDQRAGQLLGMLDDLLELAHLKEIPTTSKLGPVDAAAILEAVASGFQPDAEAKGLELRVQIRARPTILAQSGHLRSLWKHLIDNAIRYTSRGQITVTLDEQDGRVVTSVTDSGIGVSTDELSRIFEEFYRTDSAREEVELGTGLGLPIVNQVVKVYRGSIQIDSSPGKGSTFQIDLPLAPPDPGA
jgi:signal transduction histidine kinase